MNKIKQMMVLLMLAMPVVIADAGIEVDINNAPIETASTSSPSGGGGGGGSEQPITASSGQETPSQSMPEGQPKSGLNKDAPLYISLLVIGFLLYRKYHKK